MDMYATVRVGYSFSTEGGLLSSNRNESNHAANSRTAMEERRRDGKWPINAVYFIRRYLLRRARLSWLRT